MVSDRLYANRTLANSQLNKKRMETKTRPEKSKNSLQERVMDVVEAYAEKCVRKEKTGYLELLKIRQRAERIMDEKNYMWRELYAFVERERENGYDEKDLRFFCFLSTHDAWHTWMGVKCENRRTSNTFHPSHKIPLHYDPTTERKETFLEMKDLEREYQKEEQKAREYLHTELKNLGYLREQVKAYKQTIGDLEKRLEKYEPEEEDGEGE